MMIFNLKFLNLKDFKYVMFLLDTKSQHWVTFKVEFAQDLTLRLSLFSDKSRNGIFSD